MPATAAVWLYHKMDQLVDASHSTGGGAAVAWMAAPLNTRLARMRDAMQRAVGQ